MAVFMRRELLKGAVAGAAFAALPLSGEHALNAEPLKPRMAFGLESHRFGGRRSGC